MWGLLRLAPISTYMGTYNKHIFFAAASDKCMCLFTSLYGTVMLYATEMLLISVIFVHYNNHELTQLSVIVS